MSSDPILRFPPFEIDLAGERLMRGTETIRLRPKTFAVLRYLAEHPGRMVSRRELLSAVLPDVHVGDGLPKDSVLEIRRALGDDPRTPRFIETVHARGYRFVAPVDRGADRGHGGAGLPAEPPPGIVGRDAELERLAICLDRAAGGARQVVFVSGEAGIGKYDPERARPYRAMFDLAGLIEPRVTCAVYGAILSCMRGHLDRALVEIDTGRRVANELASAYAQVTASAFGAMVHESRREPAAVAERAVEVLALARQHGFPQWAGLAMALRGWALAAQGQHEAGLAELREGLETWRGTGTEIGRTYLLSLLADAHGRAGDVERALAVLDEAIVAMDQSGERLLEAELLRLRGEMLDTREPDSAEAERCLRDALAIARRRGARLLELRVATSFARRWIGRAQRAKARRLLTGVCSTFTEGAGTGDLEAARALLRDDDS